MNKLLKKEDLSRDLLFHLRVPFCPVVQLTGVRFVGLYNQPASVLARKKGAHKVGLLDTPRENPYTYEVPFWRAGRVVEGARLEIV